MKQNKPIPVGTEVEYITDSRIRGAITECITIDDIEDVKAQGYRYLVEVTKEYRKQWHITGTWSITHDNLRICSQGIKRKHVFKTSKYLNAGRKKALNISKIDFYGWGATSIYPEG